MRSTAPESAGILILNQTVARVTAGNSELQDWIPRDSEVRRLPPTPPPPPAEQRRSRRCRQCGFRSRARSSSDWLARAMACGWSSSFGHFGPLLG